MIARIRNFFSVYKRRQNGSAAVEFSLVAIPFLLAVFGVMEAGRIMWTVNGVQYAIEETGRQISINEDLTADEIQTLAKAKLAEMLINPDNLNITSTEVSSGGVDFMEISAGYQMATLISVLISEDFGDFNIESSVKTPLTE